MNLKENLNKKTLIFDGAMGTYMSSLNKAYTGNYEMAGIEDKELVARIHKDYIDAGANVITTNTFAANRLSFSEETARKIIEENVMIAKKAAEGKAFVCASVGQINAVDEVREAEYLWVCKVLLEQNVENFIFETQSSLSGIAACAQLIRKSNPSSCIIVSVTVNDSGFTTEGKFLSDIAKEVELDPDIDFLGINCGLSAVHMVNVIKNTDIRNFIAMPNAGYPIIVNRRTVYEGSPEIFAQKSVELLSYGALGLGGCCGTTPEHIRALVSALKEKNNAGKTVLAVGDITENKAENAEKNISPFYEKLSSGKKVIAVELDPPADADLTKFLNGIKDLKKSKADIITIADNPIGRARMDSSLLACKVYREYGIEALPHMTCRDRNLNAIQSLMLGLYSEGIKNMLLVTGDPVPSAQRDEVKAVYQFNSRKFAAFARGLSERMFEDNMHFFAALNVNARNFDVQMKIAREKVENGMVGFLTQPILTKEAFENLKRAKSELDAYILGGIIPVVSERNARFMNSEISGINVDEKVIEMYAGLERDEAEDLAVEISSEIARQITPYCDGYYFMTPFQRTALIRRIIDNI